MKHIATFCLLIISTTNKHAEATLIESHTYQIIDTRCVTDCYQLRNGEDFNNKRFPPDFMIGTASASYQVEGAWNEDGKGENIWDRVTHTIPSPITDNSTGDIACDSYRKYKEDVALLKDLGVNTYRFSISWSRILPTGYINQKNEAGINYYKNLIRELKDNDIEPLVSIYHWDLPQPLQDVGGWPNDFIIDRYVDYAETCFQEFGSEVKHWLTFNEPKQTCQSGYGDAAKAPLLHSPGIGGYLCTHNVIRAHAKTWHLYNEKYRASQQGYIGITLDTAWFEPNSTDLEDLVASDRVQQFNLGWYAHPILLGDYPDIMKLNVGERSIKQGFKQSRLPAFTDEEIEYIKNSVDFLGINFYSSNMAYNINDTIKSEVSWAADAEVGLYQKEEWEGSASGWLKVTPWGLRKLMNWIKNEYGDIPIFITENGISDDGSSLEDDQRIRYFQSHLSNLRDALDDGVNVIGYTAWTIMDNFEWLAGYTERFGLYSVNFTDPNRTRTPKKSVGYYRQFAATRCVVDDSQCID